MNRNVGGVDRALRIVAGIILIALAATGTIGWWGWLGLLPLASGLIGFCGLYRLLGLNTCRIKSGQS